MSKRRLYNSYPLTGLALLAGLALAVVSCSEEPFVAEPVYPLDGVLRLDHLQVRGTHNSYHLAPDEPVHPSHTYTQPTLLEQLDIHGVRAFEIDVHVDRDDGFVVYHLPLVDDRSSCHLLTDCLGVLADWSDDHPGHHPLFVWLEPKDDLDAIKIDDYEALDAAIRSVWPADRLFTPDDLRGQRPSLRDALDAEGWPTLGALRNQVLVVLLDGGIHFQEYTRRGTSLEGRAMFATTDDLEGALAAIVKINNPASPEVAEALALGLIVASNVDGADVSAADNQARLQAGLDGGSHMLMSDFPEPAEEGGYGLQLPGGAPSRCNPVTAPPECASEAIERLAQDE